MTNQSKGALLACLLVAGAALPAAETAGAESAPVTWSTQLRSTAYFLQQAPPGGTELEDRVPFYQHLQAGAGNLAGGRLDFRFSGRYGEDLNVDGGVPVDGKWFVGYGQLRLDPWETRVRVGRQFLQEGALFSTLDGGWVALRPHRQWRLNGWAGSTAPGSREFEFGEDFRGGGRLVFSASPRLTAGAWAEHRRQDGEELATRVGGELNGRLTRATRGLARANYDTRRSELERLDLLLNWRERRSWPELQLQYVLRRPALESGSWWETFGDRLHDVNLVRGAVRLTNRRGVGAEVQAFGSFVDDRRTGQLGAAFLSPHLRIGAGFLDGDAGEHWRIYGDFDWTFPRGLELMAGATFFEYALVADPVTEDYREMATSYVRGAWSFVEGARLTAEVQALANELYSSDVRLLLGLDLAAGRGATRYGIGAGGAR